MIFADFSIFPNSEIFLIFRKNRIENWNNYFISEKIDFFFEEAFFDPIRSKHRPIAEAGPLYGGDRVLVTGILC